SEFNHAVLGIGGSINASTICRRHQNVAIGAHQIRGNRSVPRTETASTPERKIGSLFVAVGSFQRKSRRLHRARHELNCSSQTFGTIKIRNSTPYYFHTL